MKWVENINSGIEVFVFFCEFIVAIMLPLGAIKTSIDS